MRGRNLRIGIPNRGRLSSVTRNIFIDYLGYLDDEVKPSRRYFHTSKDGQIDFLLARSEDIPRLIASGAVDAGITGRDYVVESGEELLELIDLNLLAGDVSILVPRDSGISQPSELNGMLIATQLPNLARGWISDNDVENSNLLVNKGANEGYVHYGLADATLDIVSTGETARSNGLKPVMNVLYSSGRLYANERSYQEHKEALNRLANDLKIKYLEQ